MSTTNIDEGKLNAFIGQMLSDLGGASSIAMVRMGDALGLYKTIQAQGPMTSMELAKAAKVDERYLREWLSHQAASNYLSYDPATAKFALPPEQAMVFANEESPVYMMGGFDVMVAMLDNQPKVQAAFKSGTGVAWGDQAGCMFCAVARFFRPAYHNNLVSAWLPALEGVVKKLEAGARVADVGCGHGWSTVLMAKAFPKSQFIGYDFHPDSIRDATAREATTISVSAAVHDDQLVVTASDDGAPRAGSLVHVADRVGALGGVLEVAPTLLRAEIPCA